MSDNTATIVEQRKSRRGLLALVGAGGAAAVAALLGRSSRAEAYEEKWSGTYNDAVGIFENTGNGIGVQGIAAGGVWAGVHGVGSAKGVKGIGGVMGVEGYTDQAGGIGVRGASLGGAGVKGDGKPGVHGRCFLKNGSGVKGEGDATGTIGGFFKNTPSRRALRTQGKIQADCCRKKTLFNMSNLITLPTSVKAGSTAAILATMQGNPGNDAVIQRAYRVDSSHIRIVFNKKPARGARVAYWVVHPA